MDRTQHPGEFWASSIPQYNFLALRVGISSPKLPLGIERSRSCDQIPPALSASCDAADRLSSHRLGAAWSARSRQVGPPW